LRLYPSDQDGAAARTIDCLTALPGFVGLRHNPVLLIRAVNRAHAMGREKALAALKLYCERAVQEPDLIADNAILVARVLFSRRAGPLRDYQLGLGRPDIDPPADPATFLLFPLQIQRDIPLLLIGGYTLGGEAEPPLSYIDWCARECDFRAAPLHPSDDPLQAVDEFLADPAWMNLRPDARNDGMLRLQALRCVSDVRPVSEADVRALSSGDVRTWKGITTQVQALGLTWNTCSDRYDSNVARRGSEPP
jgi:hypothetical protein